MTFAALGWCLKNQQTLAHQPKRQSGVLNKIDELTCQNPPNLRFLALKQI
jgi:hypothetical protein